MLAILISVAFAAGIAYHSPSQAVYLPLIGIPLLMVGLIVLPSHLTRHDLFATPAWPSGVRTLLWLFLAWLAWLTVGLLWSAWPILSWWYLLTFAWYPIAFMVLLTLPGSAPSIRDGVFAVAVIGIGYGFGESLLTGVRADSLFIDPNSFAALVNLLLFAAWAETLVAARGSARRYIFLAILGLFAATLVLTRSRGGWIAFSGGLVLAGLVLWRLGPRLERGQIVGTLGSVGLGLLVGAVLIGFNDLFSRTESIAGYADNARWMIWASTLKMIAAHGFFGTGLATFTLFYPQFRNPAETGTYGDMAHNDYLQLLLETGVPGLLLFVAIACVIFWLFLRCCYIGAPKTPDNRVAASCAGGLMGLVAVLTAYAHALVNFVFYETPITIAAGVFLALAITRLLPKSRTRQSKVSRPAHLSLIAVVLCVLLSVGLVIDAGIGRFMSISNDDVPVAVGVDGWRYKTALLLSTFYPLNTKATKYLMSAQLRVVNASQSHRIKNIARELVVDNAKQLLAFKTRDCDAQTLLAYFSTAGLRRKDVEKSPVLKQAQRSLERTIKQLPLCVAAYLADAELLHYLGESRQALEVLMSATTRFDTRVEQIDNRLLLVERAGQVAAKLGRIRTAMRMALSLLRYRPDNEWAQAYVQSHNEPK